ncbi:MAG: hypothetical protein OHK0017_06080 [Patescibacteria group bacterium]
MVESSNNLNQINLVEEEFEVRPISIINQLAELGFDFTSQEGLVIYKKIHTASKNKLVILQTLFDLHKEVVVNQDEMDKLYKLISKLV